MSIWQNSCYLHKMLRRFLRTGIWPLFSPGPQYTSSRPTHTRLSHLHHCPEVCRGFMNEGTRTITWGMMLDVWPLLHCVLTVTSSFPIANRLWSTWSSHCFLSSFSILIDPGQDEDEDRQREVIEPPTVAFIAPTINTIQLTTLRTNFYSSTNLVPRLLCVGMKAWERGYSSTYRQGCKVQPRCYGNLDSLLLGETRQNLIGYC